MAYPTAMTPELEAQARRLVEEGLCRAEAARLMGVSPATLLAWSRRSGLAFRDGRGGGAAHRTTPAFRAAARANWAKARAAAAAAKRLPLTDVERRRYHAYKQKASKAGVAVTRADAFRAIGRPDLAEAQP